MVVPDLGSRPYPADYFDSKTRTSTTRFSTAGHNTVVVGGRGQVPGKPGALKGPFEGERFTTLVGVADEAYEVKTPRARRHVVFVDKSYFVLLDEIETAEPAPVELRFHSYAWNLTARAGRVDGVGEQGRPWTSTPASAGPSESRWAGTVEPAVGWTKPVNVLRVKGAADGRRFVLATAIVPSTATQLKDVAVAQRIDGTSFAWMSAAIS